MTEEIIKECKNCDALGIDSEIGVYYCCLSHRQDDLPKEFTCNDFTPNKQLKRLEQENKNIINEYNKLQAEIIGDIEFKELILTGITPLKVLQNLKQRNRELQAFYDVHESFKTDFDTNRKLLDNYRSALEEIREIINGHASPSTCEYWGSYKNACEPCALRILNQVEDKIQNRINEVLK